MCIRDRRGSSDEAAEAEEALAELLAAAFEALELAHFRSLAEAAPRDGEESLERACDESHDWFGPAGEAAGAPASPRAVDVGVEDGLERFGLGLEDPSMTASTSFDNLNRNGRQVIRSFSA